jgi:hypothetical protein
MDAKRFVIGTLVGGLQLATGFPCPRHLRAPAYARRRVSNGRGTRAPLVWAVMLEPCRTALPSRSGLGWFHERRQVSDWAVVAFSSGSQRTSCSMASVCGA